MSGLPLPDHSPHLLATRDTVAGIVAGSAPAAHIVLAIRNALLAMGAPLAETNRPLISDIIALLAQATPIVAEANAPRYAKEAVYLGIGALSGLLDQLLIPTGEREPLGLSVARMRDCPPRCGRRRVGLAARSAGRRSNSPRPRSG